MILTGVTDNGSIAIFTQNIDSYWNSLRNQNVSDIRDNDADGIGFIRFEPAGELVDGKVELLDRCFDFFPIFRQNVAAIQVFRNCGVR